MSETTPEAPAVIPDTVPEAAPDLAAEAEKWKALARKHEDQAKANADKARQFDEVTESQKSEQQKLTEAYQRTQAERDTAVTDALRFRIGIRHGLAEEDLDLLGSGTEEQISARAERLASLRAAAQQPATPAPGRRPVESLRPGASPEPEPTEDVQRVVDLIRGRS